jgi:hypothetical protein
MQSVDVNFTIDEDFAAHHLPWAVVREESLWIEADESFDPRLSWCT